MSRHTDALPRHCSPLDRMLYNAGEVAIGQFRCETGHPDFRDTGPINRTIIVFPRTSVWIRHEGSRRFVADPNVVTIYNRGQRYERFPISPAGDRCDWFALPDALAREVASVIAPSACDTNSGAIVPQHAACSARLYARQRALVARVMRGNVTSLEAEQAVLELFGHVIQRAAQATPDGRSATTVRRRELAEAAREELARTALANRSVSDIARSLGTTPFHLCRVFREQVGLTLHAYRVRLRICHAMSCMDGATSTRATFSAIAYEAGFASHAHFVRICRRELGMTPTSLRSAITTEQNLLELDTDDVQARL